VRRERPVPRLHGLGDALVLGPGLARNSLGRTPGGHDAHRLLPATRIQCLRDLLDDDARRRGDGQQLPVGRLDRLRAAGDVGGLAHRLATMVGRQAAYAYQWTSHLPVVSPEGRVFGRPGNRQELPRLPIPRWGIADYLSPIAPSGSPTATWALSFSGSISIARLRWTNSSHCGRPRTRRSFPNLRTNRGSCASLWPPILMATSFVSSMISEATHKRTTHRAKSSSVYRFTRITGRPDAEDSLRLADDPRF